LVAVVYSPPSDNSAIIELATGSHTLEMANSFGLQQIVTEPTRDDQILESVITDLVSTATTFAKLGTSDYNPVLVKLQVPIYRDRPYRRRVWRYDKADYWDMRGYISSADWPSVFRRN
ncbi:unnamed protein product, partial [Porites evermanni]